MKLAIVGTGVMTKEVLPQLGGWGWQPVALCGTPRSAAETARLCAEHGVLAGYSDVAEMLAKTEADAVYIAVPNHLHAPLARQALEQGKNVILEKPFSSNDRESAALAALARQKNLFLFEAISTLYLPNYQKTKEWLGKIGKIKLVSCNFSQYSRRYNAFCAGEVASTFDPAQSGGALMDLNVYNLHWLLGLFGAPKQLSYAANVERGIDTSGVLLLEYDGFRAVAIGAKDCSAPCRYTIQGTAGYIQMESPANACRDATLHLNDGTQERYAQNPASRLEPEFRFFAQQIAAGDRRACDALLDHSLAVSRALTQARRSAGIRFPADAG